MFKKFFEELYQYRYILHQQVIMLLTLRYRRTALGFVWTLINPLVSIAVIATVFSMLLRFNIENFAVFVFSALIPWSLINASVIQGGDSILNAEGLLKKVFIPPQLFPVATCLALLIDSFLSTIALYLVMLFIGAPFSIALLFLPVSFLLVLCFIVALSLMCSVAFVYLRDLKHIVSLFLQTVFYLTPIIYPLTIIPEKFQSLFYLNPLYYLIEIFRAPIYEGCLPRMHDLMVAVAISITSLMLAIYGFQRFRKDLLFRL